MRKDSKVAIRGRVKGQFELHFDGVLEKEIVITRKICNEWNDISSRFIIGGGRSDKELIRLFETHFKIKLKSMQTLQEICAKWSEWDERMKRNDENWEDSQP